MHEINSVILEELERRIKVKNKYGTVCVKGKLELSLTLKNQKQVIEFKNLKIGKNFLAILDGLTETRGVKIVITARK